MTRPESTTKWDRYFTEESLLSKIKRAKEMQEKLFPIGRHFKGFILPINKSITSTCFPDGSKLTY